MARKIIWTRRADLVFTKLLEYYLLRNKSKEYSRKLNKEIRSYFAAWNLQVDVLQVVDTRPLDLNILIFNIF